MIKLSQIPGVKIFKNNEEAFAYIVEELNRFHLKPKTVKKPKVNNTMGVKK